MGALPRNSIPDSQEIIRRAAARGFDKTYRKDQICVVMKEPPTEANIDVVKQFLIESMGASATLTPEQIKVKTCDQCNCPMVLFEGDGLDTIIVAEGVRAGSGPRGGVVGELSLNYYIPCTYDKWNNPNIFAANKPDERPLNIEKGKQKVIVAVLDTGYDKVLLDPEYIWERDENSIPDPSCYNMAKNGWNFANLSTMDGVGSEDTNDDNKDKHGSLVSQFIINEFKTSKKNYVKIMPLKTHSANGVGDLFGITCAIHFAMAGGANIINASWGFYNHLEIPLTYLDELITVILPKNGILFVAAAGNKSESDDAIAREIHDYPDYTKLTNWKLRNIEFNHFYPASLSFKAKNVITVTTTNGVEVSPTQNFSENHVDLGVFGEVIFKFNVPFFYPDKPAQYEHISGSSFAAAVATGIIGAKYFRKGYATEGVSKAEIIKFLKIPTPTMFSRPVLVVIKALGQLLIRNGACVNKPEKSILPKSN